ncbi:8621_t:CDS:2, partial [Diversispora eburnea]
MTKFSRATPVVNSITTSLFSSRVSPRKFIIAAQYSSRVTTTSRSIIMQGLPTRTIIKNIKRINEYNNVCFTTSAVSLNDPFGSSQYGSPKTAATPPPINTNQSQSTAPPQQAEKPIAVTNVQPQPKQGQNDPFDLGGFHADKPFKSKVDPNAQKWIGRKSNIPEAEFFDVKKSGQNMPRDTRNFSYKDNARPTFNSNFSSAPSLPFDDFQKLVDAVAEHGSNDWKYISKVVFEDAYPPETLSAKWQQSVQKFGNSFWTTKEIKKLSDAVQSVGEDWGKISVDVFDNTRTPVQCESKWLRLNGKTWESRSSRDYSQRDYPQKDYSYSSQRGSFNGPFQKGPAEWTEEDTRTLIEAVDKQGSNWDLIAEKYYAGKQNVWNLQVKWVGLVTSKINEFLKMKKDSQDETKSKQFELPKEISSEQRPIVLAQMFGNQWSNFVQVLGQRFVKLDINYSSPQELPWTKEENDKLFATIKEHGFDWKKISEALPNRSEQFLRERAGGTTLWTRDEMIKFEEGYAKHQNDWTAVATFVNTKAPGQCWAFWKTTTGADVLEGNTDKISDTKVHRVGVKVTYPDSKTEEMTFVRYSTSDA